MVCATTGAKENVPALSYQLAQMWGGRGRGEWCHLTAVSSQTSKVELGCYYNTILEPCGEQDLGGYVQGLVVMLG